MSAKCDVCTSSPAPAVAPHPLLPRLSMCAPCLKSYTEDPESWTATDGKDDYCRVCSDGGEVVSCSTKCNRSICKDCCDKHFAAEGGWAEATGHDGDNWVCYLCQEETRPTAQPAVISAGAKRSAPEPQSRVADAPNSPKSDVESDFEASSSESEDDEEWDEPPKSVKKKRVQNAPPSRGKRTVANAASATPKTVTRTSKTAAAVEGVLSKSRAEWSAMIAVPEVRSAFLALYDAASTERAREAAITAKEEKKAAAAVAAAPEQGAKVRRALETQLRRQVKYKKGMQYKSSANTCTAEVPNVLRPIFEAAFPEYVHEKTSKYFDLPTNYFGYISCPMRFRGSVVLTSLKARYAGETVRVSGTYAIDM